MQTRSPIHLRLTAALDGFQLLRVIAAVYDDILADAGGEDFPFAVLEVLPQRVLLLVGDVIVDGESGVS